MVVLHEFNRIIIFSKIANLIINYSLFENSVVNMILLVGFNLVNFII